MYFDIHEVFLMSKRFVFLSVLAAVLLLAAPPSAWAYYVGPGSGLTVIGAALAFLGSVVLAIIGFLWYPIKRLLRLRSKNAVADRM